MKNDNRGLTFGSTPVLLEKSIPYYLARYEQSNAKQPAKSIMKEPKYIESKETEPQPKFYIPVDEMESSPKPKPVEKEKPKTKAAAPAPQKQATPAAPKPKVFANNILN